MNRKIILHLCADIGSDSKYYAQDPAYNVIRVGKDIGVENFDPPDNVYGIIANPPCTHFSIARTTAKTPRDLNEGMRLVKECLRIIWTCQANQYKEPSRTSPLKFWALENPATGFLRWFLGKPAFVYCQSEYGQPWTKKTALWGMFNTPFRPLLSMNPNALTLGGRNFTGYKNMRGDGSRKAECPDFFAKCFYEANK